MRPFTLNVLLLLLALLMVVLALSSGTYGVDPAGALKGFLGNDAAVRDVVLSLRLPRVLAAFGCGSLLALAGALLQALLRNQLADPFVLGISGGAGAFALFAMLFGFAGASVAVAGIGGALLSTLLLFGLAWRAGLVPTRLLLAGIVLSSIWGAAVTLMLAVAPDAPLRGMVFWLMGDFSAVTPEHAWLPLLAALVALVPAWILARGFDAMGQGELNAAALGVSIFRLRSVALVMSAIMTALVVITAGSIGFIGLVTPHLLRLAGLRRHRQLLPACVIAGGTLLLAADTVARTLVAPHQLPVGAITAAIGAPVFLWLLVRSNPRP